MNRLMLWALLFALGAAAGCGGGDDDDDEPTEKQGRPIEGTFVGKASATKAFVAVVAAPAAKGRRRRDATVFVCDAERLCEWLSGSADANSFTAAAGDDAKASGAITPKVVRGRIELASGRTVKYVARRAAATAGLYTLNVSRQGRLTGVSAGGVGLTGSSTLPSPGPGTLKLADGSRLKFQAVENATGDPIALPAGELRLIVLGGGKLRGAGKSRGGGEGPSDVFVRSPSS